jgi:hypothetical protein
MYEYYPLSPHNGITIANLFISLFSPVSDNFEFHGIIIIIMMMIIIIII